MRDKTKSGLWADVIINGVRRPEKITKKEDLDAKYNSRRKVDAMTYTRITAQNVDEEEHPEPLEILLGDETWRSVQKKPARRK